MLATVLGLGTLAILLVWPVPVALARACWVLAEPRAALVLWQALGLAAGFAVFGAVLALALAPLGSSLPTASVALFDGIAHGRPGLRSGHLFLLATASGVLIWLLAVTATSSWRTHRCRRRQRELIDLVSTPWPDRVSPSRPTGATARLIEHPAAAAYCLPGAGSRIVITTGVLSLLDSDELDAVLAHEHAHLAERHDLVVLPFAAWSVALFGLTGPSRARSAVQQLVEMVADDRACRGRSRVVLAAALARVGTAGAGPSPPGSLASAQWALLPRVRRLLDPPARSLPVRTAAYVGAVAVLAAPAVALVLPLLP